MSEHIDGPAGTGDATTTTTEPADAPLLESKPHPGDAPWGPAVYKARVQPFSLPSIQLRSFDSFDIFVIKTQYVSQAFLMWTDSKNGVVKSILVETMPKQISYIGTWKNRLDKAACMFTHT